MFGMGFTEILLIAVIAILFLGPDKLPSAMVEIAKLFRSVKSTIGSVKDSLEEEMQIDTIKQEALAYKKELLKASDNLHKVTNVQATIGAEIDNILNDDENKGTNLSKELKTAPKEAQEVTFKKKKKKKNKDLEKKLEEKEDSTDV